MNYPRGLIRYTSERELEGGHTHWARPRIIGYAAVLTLMVGVFAYNVVDRIPMELTVMRDRTSLYVATDAGDIDNIYTLSLVNMDAAGHQFRIEIDGLPGAEIIGETLHRLDGGEVRSISLRVRTDPARLDRPSSEFNFTAVATDMPSLRAVSESRFIKPI